MLDLVIRMLPLGSPREHSISAELAVKLGPIAWLQPADSITQQQRNGNNLRPVKATHTRPLPRMVVPSRVPRIAYRLARLFSLLTSYVCVYVVGTDTNLCTLSIRGNTSALWL